jgi:hypothetical protein
MIERKENLGHLPPKRLFISADPPEGEVGQIGEAQKALGKVAARVGGRFVYQPGRLMIGPLIYIKVTNAIQSKII